MKGGVVLSSRRPTLLANYFPTRTSNSSTTQGFFLNEKSQHALTREAKNLNSLLIWHVVTVQKKRALIIEENSRLYIQTQAKILSDYSY